ncbi:MAG: DHA2 family efflux MFS transporter permease subunit [Anaerolineales bacterium]|jgi:EmrB/QacA subfamily drug resistance transporter
MTQSSSSRFFNIETKWLVLIAIGIGTFMSALDGSVVNTILPVIRDHFNTDVATIEWVVTTYLLVVSGLLLSVGRLGDLRGNKVAYIWGFVVFVAGSGLCGLSPTPVFLISARGLQAIGASMLFANSPAILTKNFPASQRGQALGLQGAMTYLGLTTGPFLGGWLADTFGWHSVFYINIPIGLIAITLSLIVIPRDKPAGQTEKFDLAGASTFLVGLVALLFALNQGHNLGWTSPLILGLFIASILILSLFTWIEMRIPTPMLDLSLFKRRVFSMSTISPILNYICVYSVLFLTPFYLIQGRGLSASQAGLILTSQPIIMALTAPVSGRLSDKVGSRIPTTMGMLIFATGLFTLSRLTLESPFWMVVLGLAIGGLGTGLFVAPNNSALMGDAPRNRQGIAAGVLALSRNVGMVLGIGLTGAIFTTFLSKGNPGDADTLVHAFNAGLLFASGVALLASIASFARGDDRPKGNI